MLGGGALKDWEQLHRIGIVPKFYRVSASQCLCGDSASEFIACIIQVVHRKEHSRILCTEVQLEDGSASANLPTSRKFPPPLVTVGICDRRCKTSLYIRYTTDRPLSADTDPIDRLTTPDVSQ